MRYALAAIMVFLAVIAANAFPQTSDEFDQIRIGGTQQYVVPAPLRDDTIINVQIIMDRAGYSPGVIDGLDTPRFKTAFNLFAASLPNGLSLDDEGTIARLLALEGTPFVSYEITEDDLDHGFTPKIPFRYIEQASMKRINFRSPSEMLAEKFHMDERFLLELNEGRDFSKVGTTIRVASVGQPLQRQVVRVEADKSNLQVRAYDAHDKLVAVYPASIGSDATPSPTGMHTVRNKAQNPAYTYDPNGSAQPGQSRGLVLLPPGPNGPVGDAWIGLSKKTYGIHGTPEPSKIGITASVGCVRLTNWDALELARLVRRGVKVTFVE